MTEKLHEKRCERCIRRMDIDEYYYDDQFGYRKGTFDCPAQISIGWDKDAVQAIEVCGCCSFESGIESVEECRFRDGEGDFTGCECHNTRVVFGTCLSKRNHECCPYELKGDKDES